MLPYYVLYVLLMPLSLYGVKLQQLPLDFHRIFYPFFILTTLYFSFVKRGFFLRSLHPSKVFLLTLVLSLWFSGVVLIYTGSSDFTYIRMHLDYLLTFFFVMPILGYVFVRNAGSEITKFDLTLVIILSGAVQAVVMILMLFFREFQAFLFAFIDTQGAHMRLDSEYRFRAIGLTGFASYSMAVCQSFVAYLFIPFWMQRRGKLVFLISVAAFFCVVFSALLSARTAFIFVIPLYIWILLVGIIFWRTAFSQRLLFIFFSSAVVVAGVFILLYTSENDVYRRMISWVAELFLNYIDSGKLTTSSTESLKALFFLPSDNTILWGDGKYLIDGVYYKQTDVGYLRVLLYGGIWGSVLLYLSFASLFAMVVIYSVKLYGRAYGGLHVLYFILFFVVNVKGSIFFDGFSALKFIVLYAFLIIIFSYKESRFSRLGSVI